MADGQLCRSIPLQPGPSLILGLHNDVFPNKKLPLLRLFLQLFPVDVSVVRVSYTLNATLDVITEIRIGLPPSLLLRLRLGF